MPTLPIDLAIGATLFLVTFVIWLTTRALGAGDVKLIGVTGAIVGAQDAFLFAVLLMVFSLVFVASMYLLRRIQFLPIAFSNRLIEMTRQRRVPYGVPIALAAGMIIAKRLFQ
jgi:Flp pilus assembly protein protease CpaA